MQLNAALFGSKLSKSALVNNESLLQLPEKVIQFGTGVLLRGLTDYYIDKANKQGLFKGRVVVVKSTGAKSAESEAFAVQDALYTHLIKGVQEGQIIDEHIINSSISRVLQASTDWYHLMQLAEDANIQLIVSNTTEVGIVLDETDSIFATPPTSFPGKLLAFLYKRYQFFNGSEQAGVAIVPTELIVDNGLKLKQILVQLAQLHNLDATFMNWLLTANDFCNTLVDRIVPGKPTADEYAAATAQLGYNDALMLMSESYSLWAIETSKSSTREILAPLVQCNPEIIIAENIEKYRELKLRILNGAHTLACGVAVLMGFKTVKQAMANSSFEEFITKLIDENIVPAILSNDINAEEALQFGKSVLDRFRNPFLAHQWLSISLQFSSKMRMRNLPTIKQYIAKQQAVPLWMAKGFAAYLIFMKSVQENDLFVGIAQGEKYIITDPAAPLLSQYWQQFKGQELVKAVLSDTTLWGENLYEHYPAFADAVEEGIAVIESKNIHELIIK